MRKRITTVSNSDSGRLKSMFARMSATDGDDSIQPSSYPTSNHQVGPPRDRILYTYKNNQNTQKVYSPYKFDAPRNKNIHSPIEEVDEMDFGFFHGDLFTTRHRSLAPSHSRDNNEQSCYGLSSNSFYRTQPPASFHSLDIADQSCSSTLSSISSDCTRISSISSSTSSVTQDSSKLKKISLYIYI